MATPKAVTRITVGSLESPVRLSYLTAFIPKESETVDEKTGEPIKKYSVMVLVPKTDKAAEARIRALMHEVALDFFKPRDGKTLPKSWDDTFRDGDEEADEKGEHMKGHWFFNASRYAESGPPDVVGLELDEFTKKLKKLQSFEIKSGDFGRVTVSLRGFDVKGNKGVRFQLGNIQKLAVGDALGDARSADEDFGDTTVDEDGAFK
jgi:hypothetical protein